MWRSRAALETSRMAGDRRISAPSGICRTGSFWGDLRCHAPPAGFQTGRQGRCGTGTRDGPGDGSQRCAGAACRRRSQQCRPDRAQRASRWNCPRSGRCVCRRLRAVTRRSSRCLLTAYRRRDFRSISSCRITWISRASWNRSASCSARQATAFGKPWKNEYFWQDEAGGQVVIGSHIGNVLIRRVPRAELQDRGLF